MVREGVLEMHQHAAFAPLYLRKRARAANESAETGEASVRAETGDE
jgi:hypothetical protein